MKKTALILSVILTITAFSGCSQKNSTSAAESTAETTATPEMPTTADGINAEIASLVEITDLGSAKKVSRILSAFLSLSDEEQTKITDIDSVRSFVSEAVKYFDEDSMKLKVMSFNIYYQELTEERIGRVIETIRNESPDIVGIQEGMEDSCSMIVAALGEEYEMLGHGRDEDKTGENTNVLYKKAAFNLLDSDTMWLSNTPDEYSYFHGAACPRIMTYQVLQRKSDGQIFVHANTHLDFSGMTTRTGQAMILTEYLESKFGNKYPVVITGDFNFTEGRRDYKTITSAGYEPTNAYGDNTQTFQGFGEDSSIIDFTFVNNLFPVVSYKVCDEKLNGEWVSDHNAIVSELLLYPTYDSIK